MKLIQNTNMAFRCPSDLKERLEGYADKNNLHVSSIIRSACSDWLNREDIAAIATEEELFQIRSRAFRRLCADKSFKSVGI
jgi:predicted transcriptional regulator